MQIAHADAGFRHVFGQVFGHALGECGDQHAPAMLGDFAAFRQQIIHLLLDGADFRDGVHQAGWADHLFGKGAAGAFHLPGARRGADEDGRRAVGIPLFEFQRAVIRAAWQTEAIFGKHGLARIVAAIHAANLRHRDMAFIHDQQSVFGQIFEQRGWWFARVAACQVAAVIFNTFAGTSGFHHFNVEDGALFQPLRFQQFAFRMQLRQMFLQFILDARDGLGQRRARRDIVAIRVDRNAFHLCGDFARQRIEFADCFNLITEK